jgi:hypothetical protein
MIIGLIISRKNSDIGTLRKLIGFLLPAVGFLYERYLMGMIFNPKTISDYLVMAMVSYVLKLVIFWLSLFLMTGYVPTKPIIIVIIIITIVYFFKSLYTGQVVIGGVNNLFKSKNLGLVTLIEFFKYPAGARAADIITMYVPPIAFLLEAAALAGGKNRR